MPRKARLKSSGSTYHIMCRSISEIKLLKDDEDKLKYIAIIKKYKNLHKFDIYSYCFMDNHLHMIIDSNGADISKIMHGINFTYAVYFNKKYNRHGHLFQDRFKSKIISSDGYLMAASAYIHNNPTDIEGYDSCPEKYGYSSLATYLGLMNDPFELVNYNFVLSMFGSNLKQARERYYELVFKCDSKDKQDFEFENEGTLYVSQHLMLARNLDADQVMEYVSRSTNTPKALLYIKNCKKMTKARALLVILLKNSCNFNSTNICSYLGNITQANVSRLAGVGLKLIETNENFNQIFQRVYKNLVVC